MSSYLLWSGVDSFENLNQFIYVIIEQYEIAFPLIHYHKWCFMGNISFQHWRVLGGKQQKKNFKHYCKLFEMFEIMKKKLITKYPKEKAYT